MTEIVIYTKDWCFYCLRAKRLLESKNQTFREIKIGGNAALRAEMIERASGASTVPQIFIGDRHVGGCDDLVALDEKGALDALLGI